MIFEGNRYSRKGFLFKSFAMSAVVRKTLHRLTVNLALCSELVSIREWELQRRRGQPACCRDAPTTRLVDPVSVRSHHQTLYANSLKRADLLVLTKST